MTTWWLIEIIFILTVCNAFNLIMECSEVTPMKTLHAFPYKPRSGNKLVTLDKWIFTSERSKSSWPLIDQSLASQLYTFYRRLQGSKDMGLKPNSSRRNDNAEKKLDFFLNMTINTHFTNILALDSTKFKPHLQQCAYIIVMIVYSVFIAAVSVLIITLNFEQTRPLKQYVNKHKHIENIDIVEVINVICRMFAVQPSNIERTIALPSVFKIRVNNNRNILYKKPSQSKFQPLSKILEKVPSLKTQFSFLQKCVYTVYVMFQSQELTRLASFQPLLASHSDTTIFFTSLAKAGFKYSGQQQEVVCDTCGRRDLIENFNSPPTDPKYHRPNCKFVVMAGNPAPETRAEEIETDGSPLLHAQVPTSCATQSEHSSGAGDFIRNRELLVGNNNSRDTESRDINATSLTYDQTPISDYTGSTITASPSTPPKNTDAHNQEVGTIHTPGSHDNNQSAPSVGDGSIAQAAGGASAATDNNSFYLADSYTIPEQSFGNQDKPLTRIRCEKNPKHSNFILLNEDTPLSSLPSKLRSESLKDAILLIGQLTVKIEVYTTSSKRLTTDPVLNVDITPRVGTGSLLQKPYQECNGELDGSKNCFELFIETNRHVVFDDEEAHSSVVYFFTTRGKVASKHRGCRVEHSTVPGDYTSYLICKTNDKQLVERLNELQIELGQKVQALPRQVKMYLTEKVAVIGYPHGAGLTVTFGRSTVLHVKLTIDGTSLNVTKINNYEQVVAHDGWVRRILTYIADTCPGLSGAPVLHFKMSLSGDDIRMDMWMHNGVMTDDIFNVSVMKEALHTWGNPGAARADQHTTLPPTDSVANKVTHPKLTALTLDSFRNYRAPPAYPVYVSFQKRIESFVNWMANNIASPNDLSCSGFFYAGYSDCVRCFQCGLGLRSWKPGDNIDEEHKRHRPTCPFLQDLLHLQGATGSLLPESEIRPQSSSKESSVAYLPSSCLLQGQTSATPLDSMNKMRVQAPVVQVFQVSVAQIEQHKDLTTESTLTLNYNGRTPDDEPLMVTTTTSDTNDSLTSTPDDESGSQIVAEVNTPLPQSVADNIPSVNSSEPEHLDVTEPSDITLRLLQKENQVLKKLMLCRVCKKAAIRELFLPCGELYACSDCSSQLSHCPVCNGLILGTVTTFFA